METEHYQYTRITDRIWQIVEEDGVCCTLIRGSRLAALIDTGYGNRNLRAFLEAHISTPYIVLNTHGHPDHIGGNHRFDTVYVPREELDVLRHFDAAPPGSYKLAQIAPGDEIALGDLTLRVIPLPGHTVGSVGFLIEEEKLLVSGDALNECLWLFNYGSLSMQALYRTIQRTLELDFTAYLCGHSCERFPKEKLLTHLANIDRLNPDACTCQTILGFDTRSSRYQDEHGASELVFTMDKLTEKEDACFQR